MPGCMLIERLFARDLTVVAFYRFAMYISLPRFPSNQQLFGDLFIGNFCCGGAVGRLRRCLRKRSNKPQVELLLP